jgi:cystathionine beta-lyase
LKAHIPQITCSIPQASFLIWLDCRNLGMNQKELETFFIHEAGLGLNTGTSFGPEGYGFMRLNIGCPIETLQLAMSQLKSAIKQVKTDQ